MGGLRWLGRVLGSALLVALLVLALAPGPACVLDRGPRGEIRASPLPLALVLFDPATWQAVRNSVAVAAAVTLGSVLLGVGLGLVSAGRRFWGQGALSALAIAPLALGPLVIVPGLVMAVGGEPGWDWLAARSVLGLPCEDLARWVLLVGSGLAAGVPLVILATTGAFALLEPGWSDAARAVGASRRRIWRDVTWPILRPDAARAAAAVFAWTLVEPAAPAVLGLRRTVAVQILEGAGRSDQPTRPAAFAVLATIIGVAGWLAIRRWGGRPVARSPLDPSPRPPRAGRVRGLACSAGLAAWAAATLGPGLSVLWKSILAGLDDHHGVWSDLALGWASDPGSRAWIRNAVGSGALALLVDLLILTAIARRWPGGLTRRLVAPLEVMAPLTLAVGALATPWLVVALADIAGPRLAGWLRPLAAELSPARRPGWVLILALAATALPMLARAAGLAIGQARPALTDASLALGISPRRARRVGDPRWLGIVPARAAFLAFVLGATALAPALLLTPHPDTRTLAAGAYRLVLDSPAGTIDPRAAGPILALIALRLVGLIVATTGRTIPIGRWFRG